MSAVGAGDAHRCKAPPAPPSEDATPPTSTGPGAFVFPAVVAARCSCSQCLRLCERCGEVQAFYSVDVGTERLELCGWCAAVRLMGPAR